MKNSTILHYGTTVPSDITSEHAHNVETSHFTTKRNPASYAMKTKAEKAEVLNRMYKHPAKHGSPVGHNHD